VLKGLLAFALSRRPIILLGLLVFIGSGIIAFNKLNIEAYPNPAPVILEITAQAPGLSAEEMEKYYTIPMEIGLAATPGINVIRSTSFYGLSFVRVVFDYGIDYYFALDRVGQNLRQNVSLPNNVQPTIQGGSIVGEIYRYQLVGPANFGLTNLRTVQDWVVQRRLLSVPGVAQVVTWGGTTKEYEVEVDLHKLDAYNITIPQILTALGNSNINVGGRTINFGQQSVNIRGIGLLDSGGDADLTKGTRVDDIENVVLAQFNGSPITLKQVSNVYVGHLPRLGRAGHDLQDDVVTGIVVMNRTEHTAEVLGRVKDAVKKLNSDGTLPAGVKLVPYYDRSALVSVTTHTVVNNLIFGCILIFVIQWLFLGNLRSAMIVAANIPFALFFSIIALVLRGEEANLLSIGAVDLGIIVDSSVILVENVFRNFQSPPQVRSDLLQQLASGRFGNDPTRADAATNGWNDRLRMILISGLQVDKAIFFSVLITVAAFVPLFTMQGVEGQIFSPMARTYGYALFGALVSTFTITPVLASFLIPDQIEETETVIVRALRRIYAPVLEWTLAYRKSVVALGVLFLAVIAILIPRLSTEFLPHLEEGNLWIRATMPPTISLEAGMPYVTKIREILLRHPEIVTVVSQHGRPDDGSDAAGFYNAEFFAPLKPFEEWPPGLTKEKLIDQLQKEFANEFVGTGFNFSQYIQDNVEEALSGVKGENSVKIVGPDLQKLEGLAEQVMAEMANVKGVTDLGIFRVLGQPNLNIKIDRQKAARYGLNAGDINNVVQAALGGTVATTLLEADRQFSVTVRLSPEYRNNIDQIKNLKVSVTSLSGANAYIPLEDLATITLDTGASYIYREGNERFIPVKFSVRDRDLGSTVEEAQQRIQNNVKLPPGYRLVWAGEFGSLQSAKQRLTVIIPISIALILVLLYALFNSVRDSLMALSGIPFAIGGGVLALYLTGLAFSVSAAVGFISLFGVSVMNGILITAYYNEVRSTGRGPLDAMAHAAAQRMRPTLMMSLSACIGLLPAAISTGIGSQVQRPLAAVVVGGMFIGPILMLVVVPALQTLFTSAREPANAGANGPEQ